MTKQTFLVTGAMGCLGTWVLRNLLDQDAEIIAADVDSQPARARLIMSDEELTRIQWNTLDVTDASAVHEMVATKHISHIVHLAGLQIPFCRSNPAMGSAVNVTGTVNILEAARSNAVKGISYASSLAALGPEENYPERPIKDDVALIPTTLYGVYKAANEGTAKIYWDEWQLGSVGLRPYIVYGVARDQGLTSDLAKAVLAAAAGRPFHIRFDGPVAMQHANDVARMFIGAAQAEFQGAATCNLRGDVLQVSDFVAQLIDACPDAQITWERDAPLPYPADLDDSGLGKILGVMPYTPLQEAIAQDLERFKQLMSQGKVDLGQLEQ